MFFDNYPENIQSQLYYPTKKNNQEMERNSRSNHAATPAYKVMRRRRRKMIHFDDDISSELSEDMNLDRIPDMLTPYYNTATSDNPRHFYPHHQNSPSNQVETCRRDNDCLGSQKCCHVQVAKYRFKLGCRYPRSGNFYY
jgi:hypothetical protein